MNIINQQRFQLRNLFAFLLLAASIGCQKEVSTENHGALPGGGATGGSAVFTLVPSGNNCSDATVSGNFQAGTDLGIDTKITVTVNVTKTGDWLYSTALMNGFIFAGAGNFTNTGTQQITLQAAGKPAAAGNFDFALTIGGANCKVTVTVGDNTGNNGSTGEFYYKATIDGVTYSQAVTETNDYEAGSGMGGTDDVDFSGSVNYSNPPVPKGKTEFGIGKGIMHHYVGATKAQFKAFFTPGDYTYASSGNYSKGDGVQVSWTDANGEYWNSYDGTADQTGSTFKIISTEDIYDLVGNYYLKVKVQFSCKLYNENTGAVKQVTNGEAVVAFGML